MEVLYGLAATIKGRRSDAHDRRRHCLTCKLHVKDGVRFVSKLFDFFAIDA